MCNRTTLKLMINVLYTKRIHMGLIQFQVECNNNHTKIKYDTI
jgi:hypothetical protein